MDSDIILIKELNNINNYPFHRVSQLSVFKNKFRQVSFISWMISGVILSFYGFVVNDQVVLSIGSIVLIPVIIVWYSTFNTKIIKILMFKFEFLFVLCLNILSSILGSVYFMKLYKTSFYILPFITYTFCMSITIFSDSRMGPMLLGEVNYIITGYRLCVSGLVVVIMFYIIVLINGDKESEVSVDVYFNASIKNQLISCLNTQLTFLIKFTISTWKGELTIIKNPIRVNINNVLLKISQANSET